MSQVFLAPQRLDGRREIIRYVLSCSAPFPSLRCDYSWSEAMPLYSGNWALPGIEPTQTASATDDISKPNGDHGQNEGQRGIEHRRKDATLLEEMHRFEAEEGKRGESAAKPGEEKLSSGRPDKESTVWGSHRRAKPDAKGTENIHGKDTKGEMPPKGR